jgi:hypothetical protein
LVPLYGVPAREGRVSVVITRSKSLGRLDSRRSGLVSIRFTGHSSPGPRRDDLTIYWAPRPFVRSFILPVDPGDICPPHYGIGVEHSVEPWLESSSRMSRMDVGW